MFLRLRLEGPLQSWGVSGHFKDRDTRRTPTLSGVAGLIGNALGLKRGQHIDLTGVGFSCETVRPGVLLRDFYTVGGDGGIGCGDGTVAHKSYMGSKMFLTDASFLVELEGPEDRLREWAGALERPARPLFLGRRACVPSARVLVGIFEESGVKSAVREFAPVWDVPLGGRKFAPR